MNNIVIRQKSFVFNIICYNLLFIKMRNTFETNIKVANENVDKILKKKEENPEYKTTPEDLESIKDAFGKAKPPDQNIALMINSMKIAGFKEELQLVENFKKLDVDYQFMIIEIMKLINKMGQLMPVTDVEKQKHWLDLLEKAKNY